MPVSALSEIVLALFLLANLVLAGTGRLKSAIRIVALQGWAVGLLPLLLWDWTSGGAPSMRVWFVAAVNALGKGYALPALVSYAVRRTGARPELEPLVGFRLSRVIVFALSVACFAIGRAMHDGSAVASELAVPVALTTMGTGLFLTCARRKAITQVLGFVVFENGIAVFGSGILAEFGPVVELGILLDVFVLVFVLGIAVFQINRTFSSLDTDRMNRLGDIHLMHRRKDRTGGRKDV